MFSSTESKGRTTSHDRQESYLEGKWFTGLHQGIIALFILFSIFESGIHVTMLFVVLKTLGKVRNELSSILRNALSFTFFKIYMSKTYFTVLFRWP